MTDSIILIFIGIALMVISRVFYNPMRPFDGFSIWGIMFGASAVLSGLVLMAQ